jgi:hypothetical protein
VKTRSSSPDQRLHSSSLETRAVPHGQVKQTWYPSATGGATRLVDIYMPPGYDQSTSRYPVLYFLDDGTTDNFGWNTVGRAAVILDNLLVDKKATPMMVVLPRASPPARDPPCTGAPFTSWHGGYAATDQRPLHDGADRRTNPVCGNLVPGRTQQFDAGESPDYQSGVSRR